MVSRPSSNIDRIEHDVDQWPWILAGVLNPAEVRTLHAPWKKKVIRDQTLDKSGKQTWPAKCASAPNSIPRRFRLMPHAEIARHFALHQKPAARKCRSYQSLVHECKVESQNIPRFLQILRWFDMQKAYQHKHLPHLLQHNEKGAPSMQLVKLHEVKLQISCSTSEVHQTNLDLTQNPLCCRWNSNHSNRSRVSLLVFVVQVHQVKPTSGVVGEVSAANIPTLLATPNIHGVQVPHIHRPKHSCDTAELRCSISHIPKNWIEAGHMQIPNLAREWCNLAARCRVNLNYIDWF